MMLLAELSWERRISRMYGEDVPVPCMEVWVGDQAYTYSHRAYQPICWPPTLLTVKSEVEAAADCKFNSVLVNRYENEKDSVGWHADNEPQMSHEHPIASLSLGATRRFEMRKGILSRRLNWSMEACCHGTRNAKGMETPSTQN